MLNISLGGSTRFKFLPVTTKLAQMSYGTHGGASADPRNIWTPDTGYQWNEALHPNSAALKDVLGSLGNRKSINTFIFMFLMIIKKNQNSNANILQTQCLNYNDVAQTEKTGMSHTLSQLRLTDKLSMSFPGLPHYAGLGQA